MKDFGTGNNFIEFALNLRFRHAQPSSFVVLGSSFVVLRSSFFVLGSSFVVLGAWFVVRGSWFVVVGERIMRAMRLAPSAMTSRRAV